MRCFQHRDHDAVGVCKACQKAVCADCVQDTGKGLACSAGCAAEVEAMNQIIDRSKQIYGIGSNSRWPATGILFQYFFGLVFLGSGLFPLLGGREPIWFTVIMGAGFLALGAVAQVRTRKLQLNC